MTSKTIFCVSTADCDVFKNNFRNSFTDQLPYFQEKRPDYGMSLGSIHIDKSFRTLGLCGEKCFILLQTYFHDLDENNIANNTIHEHHVMPSYGQYESVKQESHLGPIMPVFILIILNQGRYRNTHKMISTINSDLKQLGVDCKVLFSKSQEGNKVVLAVDRTLIKCVISTK